MDGEMVLSDIGEIVNTEWLKTFEMRPDMNLYMGEYVIMPNHFHAIIDIGENKYNTNRDVINTQNGGNVQDGGCSRDAMLCVFCMQCFLISLCCPMNTICPSTTLRDRYDLIGGVCFVGANCTAREYYDLLQNNVFNYVASRN